MRTTQNTQNNIMLAFSALAFIAQLLVPALGQTSDCSSVPAPYFISDATFQSAGWLVGLSKTADTTSDTSCNRTLTLTFTNSSYSNNPYISSLSFGFSVNSFGIENITYVPGQTTYTLIRPGRACMDPACVAAREFGNFCQQQGSCFSLTLITNTSGCAPATSVICVRDGDQYDPTTDSQAQSAACEPGGARAPAEDSIQNLTAIRTGPAGAVSCAWAVSLQLIPNAVWQDSQFIDMVSIRSVGPTGDGVLVPAFHRVGGSYSFTTMSTSCDQVFGMLNLEITYSDIFSGKYPNFITGQRTNCGERTFSFVSLMSGMTFFSDGAIFTPLPPSPPPPPLPPSPSPPLPPPSPSPPPPLPPPSLSPSPPLPPPSPSPPPPLPPPSPSPSPPLPPPSSSPSPPLPPPSPSPSPLPPPSPSPSPPLPPPLPLPTTACPNQPSGSTVVARINAGGSRVEAPAGSGCFFEADTDPSPYRSGGGAAGNAVCTPDNAFASTERWGGPQTWTFPATTGNWYRVVVHISEIYFSTIGARVVGVVTNGDVSGDGIDPFARTGGQCRTFTVIDLVQATTTTTIVQLTATADNPTISAIEVYDLGANPGGAPSPPPAICPRQPVGSTVVARINAGGPAVVDPPRTTCRYDADDTATSPYRVGGIATASLQGSLCSPSNAFSRTERFTPSTWTFPATPGRSYLVFVHLAELYWTQSGIRRVNVAVNGNLIGSGIDVFNVTGGLPLCRDYVLNTTFTSTTSSTVVAITASAGDASVTALELYDLGALLV